MGGIGDSEPPETKRPYQQCCQNDQAYHAANRYGEFSFLFFCLSKFFFDLLIRRIFIIRIIHSQGFNRNPGNPLSHTIKKDKKRQNKQTQEKGSVFPLDTGYLVADQDHPNNGEIEHNRNMPELGKLLHYPVFGFILFTCL